MSSLVVPASTFALRVATPSRGGEHGDEDDGWCLFYPPSSNNCLMSLLVLFAIGVTLSSAAGDVPLLPEPLEDETLLIESSDGSSELDSMWRFVTLAPGGVEWRDLDYDDSEWTGTEIVNSHLPVERSEGPPIEWRFARPVGGDPRLLRRLCVVQLHHLEHRSKS